MKTTLLRTRAACLLLGGAGAILSPVAWAQATTQVTGTFSSVYFEQGVQGTLDGTFSCTGEPTCTGTFEARERAPRCSNVWAYSNFITITGLDLARAGSLQGQITLGGVDFHDTINPDGTCTIQTQTMQDVTLPYTGQWNGTTGTFTFSKEITVNASFTAVRSAPAPVFPMTVQSSISTTATATATFQPRAQDAGTTQSVFVFAAAPAPRVQGGLAEKALRLGPARVEPKAEPVPCVLAQMSPSGQLVAVSAAQLQAVFTGTLSAAGNSISILSNTPTPNVAGATFYLGYGASGAAMLDNGVYRNAILIPGDSVCPMLPYQTALWWNPEESGWGLNLNQQGNVAFATLFTYDAARSPMWLVMPAGSLQPDGLTFSGDLFRTTGSPFNANPFTPIGAGNVTQVGRMSIAFTHANHGVLTYTVNGASVTKGVQRQVFGARAANCLPATGSRAASTNVQDLWWNPEESGWGLNVTHQDNTLFATLFTYDAAGRGLWLVMSAGQRQADGSYLGDLFRTAGSPFNAVPFAPIGAGDVTAVGNMRLRFADGEHGTLTYTYSGIPVSKSIVRQVFSTPVSACN